MPRRLPLTLCLLVLIATPTWAGPPDPWTGAQLDALQSALGRYKDGRYTGRLNSPITRSLYGPTGHAPMGGTPSTGTRLAPSLFGLPGHPTYTGTPSGMRSPRYGLGRTTYLDTLRSERRGGWSNTWFGGRTMSPLVRGLSFDHSALGSRLTLESNGSFSGNLLLPATRYPGKPPSFSSPPIVSGKTPKSVFGFK